jgi:hypothetical protein
MEPRIAVRVMGQARNSSEFTRDATPIIPVAGPVGSPKNGVIAHFLISDLSFSLGVYLCGNTLIIFGFASCFIVCHRHNL